MTRRSGHPPFVRCLGACAALCTLAGQATEAAELRTPSYVVQITEICPEGEVGCRKVSYVGRNTRTGKSIELQGRAVMRLCADRLTPCSHEGYRFTSGAVEYRVTNDGRLLVTRGAEVLVEERGRWQTEAVPPAPAPGALARRVGIQLPSGYASARSKLLGAAWKADASRKEFSVQTQLPDGPYPEVVCGAGYDAACSGRFVKSGHAILLTFDQRIKTLPLISVDED